MPGPYTKSFIDIHGPNAIYDLVKEFDDKSACVKTILAYLPNPGQEPLLFVGIKGGTIVPPRGNLNFGWDSIFQPCSTLTEYSCVLLLAF